MRCAWDTMTPLLFSCRTKRTAPADEDMSEALVGSCEDGHTRHAGVSPNLPAYLPVESFSPTWSRQDAEGGLSRGEMFCLDGSGCLRKSKVIAYVGCVGGESTWLRWRAREKLTISDLNTHDCETCH